MVVCEEVNDIVGGYPDLTKEVNGFIDCNECQGVDVLTVLLMTGLHMRAAGVGFAGAIADAGFAGGLGFFDRNVENMLIVFLILVYEVRYGYCIKNYSVANTVIDKNIVDVVIDKGIVVNVID
nr:hypothetical protein [Tanacetum cinerariifolium]